MDVTYIKNSIAKLKTDIFMHVRHRTLQKYTGEPIVNNNQLFFLLLPFFNDEKWLAEHYEAAITASVMTASLNAHGRIKENNATSQRQQLTVLVGDYYSGRYYEILAHSSNIVLIKKLSQGVVKRCENEVKVYENNDLTVEDWLQTLASIEGALIEQVFQLYQFDEYIPIMQKSLLMNRLYDEMVLFKQGKQTALMRAMYRAATKQFENMSMEQIMLHQMNKLSFELQQLLNTTLLKQEVKQLIISVSPATIDDVSHIIREV